MRATNRLVCLAVMLGACRSDVRNELASSASRKEAIPYTGSQLGSSANPVLARGPFGEREYLQRLRCPDGTAPAFERRGSVAEVSDEHFLDAYEVRCEHGGPAVEIFMDM